jgi:lysozyme
MKKLWLGLCICIFPVPAFARHPRTVHSIESCQMTPFVTKDTYVRADLEPELTSDEGKVYTVYVDSTGHMTVGVGHNLSISQSEFVVDALLQCDINGAEAALDLYAPWWRQLDPVRQRVLMNMEYNMGWGSLKGFPKFLAAMQANNWPEAAVQMMDSLWAKQVGARATRLRDMVLTGDDPRAVVPTVVPTTTATP